MNDAAARRYFETQVMTASRERLLLLLLDGAVRFAEQGRAAIERKDYETSNDRLIRVQNIILELLNALEPAQLDPVVWKGLSGLYTFIYRRFVTANLKRDLAALAEGMAILEHVRETWRQAVEKALREGTLAPPVAAAPQAPEPVRQRFAIEG